MTLLRPSVSVGTDPDMAPGLFCGDYDLAPAVQASVRHYLSVLCPEARTK